MSKQRHLQSLGENLQLIAERLVSNQNLARYLFYTDKDPLSSDKPDVTPEMIKNTQVLMVPIIGRKDDSTSLISIRVLKGLPEAQNSEFLNIYLNIEVFVPNDQWFLKSNNLRPYLIMGEITKSLEGKKIHGLGTLNSESFSINFLTEEMSCYEMLFTMTQFR